MRVKHHMSSRLRVSVIICLYRALLAGFPEYFNAKIRTRMRMVLLKEQLLVQKMLETTMWGSVPAENKTNTTKYHNMITPKGTTPNRRERLEAATSCPS
jgi:hypothetical protein